MLDDFLRIIYLMLLLFSQHFRAGKTPYFSLLCSKFFSRNKFFRLLEVVRLLYHNQSTVKIQNFFLPIFFCKLINDYSGHNFLQIRRWKMWCCTNGDRKFLSFIGGSIVEKPNKTSFSSLVFVPEWLSNLSIYVFLALAQINTMFDDLMLWHYVYFLVQCNN